MTITRHIGLRLIIEGIEVPVIGVQTSAELMSPAVASVSVPYTQEAFNLLPRTLGHIFYYDDIKALSGRTFKTPDGDTYTRVVAEDFVDVSNPNRWKLLFTGELIGYSYSKTSDSRVIRLIFMDFTTYWDATKLYFSTKTTGNRAFKQEVFMGAVIGEKGRKKLDSSAKLLQILRTRPSTMPTLQGLLGGLVHLLETATGVYASTQSTRKFRGLSDFLSQAELRLKLTRTLGINPNDTSSAIITGDKEFAHYLRRAIKSMRSTASYGDLLRMMLDRTHHVYTPVLCPPYIPKGAKAKYFKLVPVAAKGSEKARAAASSLSGKSNALKEALDARQKEVSDRVSKSVIASNPANQDNAENPAVVPGQQTVDAFKFRVQEDGTIVADSEAQVAWKDTYVNRIDTSQAAAAEVQRTLELTIDDVTSADLNRIRQAADLYRKALDVTREELMGQASQPDPATNDKLPLHKRQAWLKAARLEKKARDLLKGLFRPKYKKVESEVTLSDRLILTLFHPRIWMCPPPVCNVFFPEDYRLFRVGRRFMQEPTRYMMFGLRRNGRRDHAQVYFAPNTDIITGNLKVKDVAKAAGQSISFLFPHEKFTGIIPSINGVGQVAALTKLNKQTEKAEPGQAFTSFGSKNPALSRAAHSNFFDVRYRPRTGSLAGPFNPRPVNGLPALVLDPRNDGRDLTNKPWLRGTHHLGFINSMTHSINQGGADTSISFSHLRPYNEGLSIFGTYEPQVKIIKKIPLGGGTKVPGNYYAEILGWRTVTRRIDGQVVILNAPIIGMGGVVGRSGAQVTVGLKLQNAQLNVGKRTQSGLESRAGDSDVGNPGILFSATSPPLLQQEVLDDAGEFASAMYRITAIFNKSKVSTASDLTAPTIGADGFVDGYQVRPAFVWMNPSALGAVKVSVHKITNTTGRFKTLDFSFYFEQIARPPWYDASYLNQNIGKEFYAPLLGCGAITDPNLLVDLAALTPEDVPGGEITGVVDPDRINSDGNTTPLTKEQFSSIVTNIKNEVDNNDTVISKAMEEDPTGFSEVEVETADGEKITIPVQVLGGTSTHEATEVIARAYDSINRVSNPVDKDKFIRDYGNRAFATIVDILGYGYRTGDMDFRKAGNNDAGVLGTRFAELFEQYDPNGEFTRERPEDALEGFHSSAFGPFQNLDLLPVEPLADEYTGTVRSLNKDVDPRKERYDRAKQYRDSVRNLTTQE